MPSNPPLTSPNVDNYFIGKGNVYFADVDAADNALRHVGNVPMFELTPKPEKKKHYSSMAGTKVLDRTVFLAKEMELQMSLEEITPDNLVVGLLGELMTDGSYQLMGLTEVERRVRFVGTNDFGARVQVDLPRVFFSVDKALALIGEDWGKLELTGDVLKHGNLGFGNLKFIESATV